MRVSRTVRVTRSQIEDCEKSLLYPFKVSLSQHASLVTALFGAWVTMWRLTKPVCNNLLGKEAMENRKMNHRSRDHDVKMRNQVVTHGQKARDMAWMAEPTFKRMDIYVSGPKVAPKVSTIIPNLELGKPYVFPMGNKIARSSNDTDGRGCDKKRKPVCNA